MPWLKDKGDCVELTLRIVPRASRNKVEGLLGDRLKVRIQAPPVEGKANTYLIKFLAKEWKLPRASIELISGDTGRNKRIRIHHPPATFVKNLREQFQQS